MPGSELKAGARKFIIDNLPKVLIISMIYVILTTVVAWFAVRLPGSLSIEDIYERLASGEIPSLNIIYTNFKPVGIFLALLMLMLQPLLDVGFMSYCLKLNRSQKTDFKDLFNGLILFIKVISIFLITTLYILLWSLLLIIPGIVAAYRYRQSYYILLDDPKKSALQCISESCIVMNGKKADLFIIDISFMGWFALDMLVFFLIPLPISFPFVSIWLSPYLGLTRVAFYEDAVSSVAV